ncbi:ATP-binding cassette domain-containing protein [Clostridium sp. CF011]|nr:ATP-binding cassette domain-containing protein [Clostridium sp. CF011]
MNNYILQTKNLCKSFKKQCAVNNISLSIEKNSVYGLLGPNGAGKSTLLKMVTGMLHPTSGEIISQ